jgi:vancomycin permeability regulator SanA
MIGEKWSDIPNFEDRAVCKLCKEMELMSHILVDCLAIERHIIWSKVRELWPHNPQFWPEINLGIIMGIGCITAPDNEIGRDRENTARSIKTKGKTRLLQILISKASHLIWVL